MIPVLSQLLVHLISHTNPIRTSMQEQALLDKHSAHFSIPGRHFAGYARRHPGLEMCAYVCCDETHADSIPFFFAELGMQS